MQRNEMNTFHNVRKSNQLGSDVATSFAIPNFSMPIETVDNSVAFESDVFLVLIQRDFLQVLRQGWETFMPVNL